MIGDQIICNSIKINLKSEKKYKNLFDSVWPNLT
jgi:hypothetical protein